MKIKEKPKKAKKRKGYQPWLIEEPKRKGRLSQLNKKNKRVKSEFILMVESIEGGSNAGR